MVTIVTDVQLKEGSEQDWDAAMRERMEAAKKQPGWVGGQMLEPEDDPRRRVIVGTWETRDDWEKWHEDPEFAETVMKLLADYEESRQQKRHSETQEQRVRRLAAARGWRIMHRRKSQYWLLASDPMTLDGIEEWLT